MCVRFSSVHIYRANVHFHTWWLLVLLRCCCQFLSFSSLHFWPSKYLLGCMLLRRCFEFFFLSRIFMSLNQIYMKYQLHSFSLLSLLVSMSKISRMAQIRNRKSAYCMFHFVITGLCQRLNVPTYSHIHFEKAFQFWNFLFFAFKLT